MTPTPLTDAMAHPLRKWADRPPLLDLLLVDADFARKLEQQVTLLREALSTQRPQHGYWDRTCDWQRIQDSIAVWDARRQAALDATDGQDRA